MKKPIFLAIVLILAASIIYAAVSAYFIDTEASTDSQVAAGTLDLKTDGADGVSQTLFNTSILPSEVVGPSIIELKNNGSTNGATVDIAFSYVESDGSGNWVDMSADDTAAVMKVKVLNYDGVSILGSVNDVNGNGYEDIYDLKNSDLSGQSGLNASTMKKFKIKVKLKGNVDEDFKSDGIDMTITFTLNQGVSGDYFSDSETSVDNRLIIARWGW